jgi:ribonuclease HI
MGAQAVIGAFRTVSSAVLQDEAGLEPVESRLAKKAAKHALDVRALPRDHPLSMIMKGMERRSDRHPSPLFETWSRYHKVIQGTKGLGVMPKLPHALPPWHDRQDLVIIQDEAEALLFHQRISMVKSKQLLYYTDASVRNGWAGIAVVKYQPHGTTTVPKVVRQETIGREKTCAVASAEIYAIKTALEFLRKDRATGWIVTDSQEALRRINSGGRSRKSEAVVQAALREIQVIREKGHEVKLIWIPGHCGIAGNERAHVAAQEMTAPGIRTMAEPERRVREYCEVFKLLRKEVEADIPKVIGTWGRYTHAIDSALPGKHTLQLYDMLSHEDAGILAQARTGHTHLNEYLARVKRADSAACACQGGAESVKHVILHCQMWTTQRQPLKEAAGERWGDVSFLVGGKSRKRDARTGELIDGDKWQPNLDVVRATIALLKSTGRFSSQAPNTNSSQQDSHGVATPVTLA